MRQTRQSAIDHGATKIKFWKPDPLQNDEFCKGTCGVLQAGCGNERLEQQRLIEQLHSPACSPFGAGDALYKW